MRSSFAGFVFLVGLVIAFLLLGDEAVDRKERAARLLGKLVLKKNSMMDFMKGFINS